MIDQLCLIYDLPDCYTALEVLFYGKRFPGPHTVSALNLKRFVELTEWTGLTRPGSVTEAFTECYDLILEFLEYEVTLAWQQLCLRRCLLTQTDVNRRSGCCFKILGDSTCQGAFMCLELLAWQLTISFIRDFMIEPVIREEPLHSRAIL